MVRMNVTTDNQTHQQAEPSEGHSSTRIPSSNVSTSTASSSTSSLNSNASQFERRLATPPGDSSNSIVMVVPTQTQPPPPHQQQQQTAPTPTTTQHQPQAPQYGAAVPVAHHVHHVNMPVAVAVPAGPNPAHTQHSPSDVSTASLSLVAGQAPPSNPMVASGVCAVHPHSQQHQQQLAIVTAMHPAAAAHLTASGGVAAMGPHHVHMGGPPTHGPHSNENGQGGATITENLSPNSSCSSSGSGQPTSGPPPQVVAASAPPPGHMYIPYGEFYPEFYLAPHPHDGICPQHHHQNQHQHQPMCGIPGDYGPAAVQMVSQNRVPPMPVPVQVTPGQMVQQYVNENATLTHVVLSPQQYQQLHAGQGHIHSPFLTTNGTSHFYSPLPSGFQPGHSGAGPTHYHAISGSGYTQQPPPQPGQQQATQQQQAAGQQTHNTHSPSPPNSYHKDERTQRQHNKLLKKLEKQRDQYNSAFSTPAHSPSPRRNDLNGHQNLNATNNNHLQAGAANNNAAVNFAQPASQYHYVQQQQQQQQQMHMNNHHNHNHNRRGMTRRNGSGVPPSNLQVSGGAPSSVGTSEDGEDAQSVGDYDVANQSSIVEQLSAVQRPEVIDITSRSAKIIWEAPYITNVKLNTADLQYNVLLTDRAKECKYKSLYMGESCDCIVQDLQPGQLYAVRFQVHYHKLTGLVSEQTMFTTPACEPDQPAPPKLQNRTKNSLQLRWAMPPSNGSAILHYQLEYDEGKPCAANQNATTTAARPHSLSDINFVEVVKVTGKSYMVKKLQPSTMYSFRLAAINEVGCSPYSSVCSFSTTGNPPSAPKPPTLQSVTSFSMRLSWDTQPQDGDFVLQMLDRETGHGFLNVYNGPDNHYECCHLKRSTAYQFRLRSENESGNSAWSTEVTYTTLPERPGRPGKPYAKGKIHGNFFKVRWDPPSDRGGAEILRYFLEISAGSKFECIYTGPEPETTCDRLQPGTTYQLRAACEGPAGVSTYSEVAHITSESIVPAAPPPPHYDNPPGPYGAVLRLEKPDYNGGAPVLEYEVQLRLVGDVLIDANADAATIVYRGKDNYCVIKDLKPGFSYEAQVRAVNRIGAGAWSAWFRFSAASAPPDAPEVAKVIVKSATHLAVSWQEPECNGSAISEYRLESAVSTCESSATTEGRDSGASATSSPPPSSAFHTCYHGLQPYADLRNLLPFTLYYFRVNASNTAGVSKWSALVNAKTPAAIPAAPQIKDYEFTATDVTLRWTAPECNGSAISGYTVEYADRSVTTTDDATEFTITDLTPQTSYRIRVQAINSVGHGPFSAYTKLTTLPSPPAPPTLECTGIGHNFIKLKWGDGRNLDFTKYYVEMYVQRAKGFQMVYTGTNCMCKVNKLQERTAYTFRIYAGNDKAGVGDYSEEYVFKTTATLPSSIKAPRIAYEGIAHLVAPGTSGVASATAAATGSAIIPSGYLVSSVGFALGVPLTLEWQNSKNTFNDRVDYVLQYAIGKDGDFKTIYRGPETKFTIQNLEPGTAYQFRVCPTRVTSAGEDLPGAYTSAFRYQVPNLPSLEELDSNLSRNPVLGANGAAAAAATLASGHPGSSVSNANAVSAGCHGHAHHSHHHAHHAHTHAHHPHHNSRSSMAGSQLQPRSVSANSSTTNPSMLQPNAIGMVPLETALANELGANLASCDDPHHHHHHHFHGFPGAVTTDAVDGGGSSSQLTNATASRLAVGHLPVSAQLLAASNNNQQQHGALRRFASKLTSVYTNRKRFTDEQKAVIYMVSFIFFTFLCATFVKMLIR